jgi:hypothetical protein
MLGVKGHGMESTHVSATATATRSTDAFGLQMADSSGCSKSTFCQG